MTKLYNSALHAVVLWCALVLTTAETGLVRNSSAVRGAVAPEASRTGNRRLLAVTSTVDSTVVEGRNVTLSCVVPDVTNTTKVKWVGPTVNRVLSINRHAMSRRFFVSGNETEGEFNLLVSSVVQADDGTYDCRAGKTFYASTRLKVLTEAGTPVISGVKWPLVEGARVTLSCRCHGGLPQPSLHWTLGSLQQPSQEVSSSHHDLTITTDLHVTRQHNGAMLSCTADQGQPDLLPPKTASLTMIVLYPPVVSVVIHPQDARVGDDVIVTCVVDSNPPVKITWKRQVQGRNVAMATTGTTAIFLRNVTKRDNGSYICHAKNNIGTSSGSGVIFVKEQV
ncbi:cell adhesion molecule 3-like [Branchiostoma floridae x Branchiostoma japonicum]